MGNDIERGIDHDLLTRRADSVLAVLVSRSVPKNPGLRSANNETESCSSASTPYSFREFRCGTGS